ncbi:hypothetical protein QLQ12_24505 [Actinoplanes sp. NEAU-A12]|uniref:Excalibur calcium-binding domain-containing protein n=1 Tax=Actinoplanes sandaracinus TaxID=3045177 RepID=A0ABT6WQ04_9ACTN|nr:hypothetical protein [Actinoplanes sandaracinus]MDI6101788.1 hypothetical protein [Actinoplanes sandaracinus]
MSRTRLAALALAAVALTAGVGWVSLTGNDPGTIRTTSVAAEGGLPDIAPTPGGPGTDPGAGPAAPGAGGPGSTGQTRELAAAGQQAARAPARRATPAPFVQPFAGQPGVTRQKPKRKPTAPVKVAPTVDGCDRSYGTIAQCVPVRFPPGVTDKCAWLRDHGFPALKVTGPDRQGLDPDRNGSACDE